MFNFFRRPRTKPKQLPVTAMTELPDDYAMLLHMLELGSISIEVTHVGDDAADIRLLVAARDGGSDRDLGIHRIVSGDVLNLTDVYVLPRQ